MANITAKTKERLIAGIKKFQPILSKCLDKDINESDTVTIIADMLTEVFGFDKYTEVTSEFAIKKTFCDLAVKVDNKVKMLIEAKAIGLSLKDDHTKQAIDYGANSGIDWVALTNGITWKIYKVIFSKPIERELVYEFDFTQLSHKKASDIEMLFYLTRESLMKSAGSNLDDLRSQKQLVNRFMVGQMLLSDTVLDTIRKVYKKMSPELKLQNEDIREIVEHEVIKRDVLDDEKAVAAKRQIAKMEKSAAKPAPKKEKAGAE